ncbi:CHAT domain-containing protein [Streptomyces sp. NPDC059979]|uniref:CHAT domain-containing protein n=1 Tax=Streptomyces sp. NPDC059979 TaxID=3347021 RepID=UPI0036B829AE
MDLEALRSSLIALLRIDDVRDQSAYLRAHPELRGEPALALLDQLYADATRHGRTDLMPRLERTEKLLRLAGQFDMPLAASLVEAGPGSDPINGDTSVPRPDETPDPVEALAHRTAAHRTAFRADGGEQDLRDALAAAREAVRTAGPGDARTPALELSLAEVLHQCYDAFGDSDALDQAIDLCRRQTGPLADDEVSRSSLHLLAECLRMRYERTGQPDDIRAAFDLLPEPTGAADPDGPRRLSDRGAAFLARYQRSGSERDLNDAVRSARQALAASAPDHVHRSEMHARLSLALEARYEQTQDPADLDGAVAEAGNAVAAVRPGSPQRARYLYCLGMALRTRYERAHDPDDLDRAISVARDGAALPARGLTRAALLHHLQVSLRLRAAQGGHPDDLAEARQLSDRAVAATQGRDDARAAMLNAAAITLLAGPADRPEADRLREAIALYEKARRVIGPDHPAKAAILVNLGSALARSGALEAAAVFREAADSVHASTSIRLTAAREWGLSVVERKEWPEALEAFDTAIGLLPRLAGIALSRTDQEAQLAAQSGLAATAAAVAVQAGQADRAVVLLEQGRGVLLSRIMDARSDVTELRERDATLADAFEQLCRALDRPPQAGPGETGPHAVDERHRRAQDWEALLDTIRQSTGLKKFLLPLSLAEIKAAAVDGPLVVVNINFLRSDALIVRPEADAAVQVVRLPASLAADVARRVEELHAYAPYAERNERLSATLAFLQDAVVAPVLDALSIGRTGSGADAAPRVWWLPTGPATFLPFHACALDRVVSSYTTTVRALLRSRDGSGSAFGRVLAVGVPDPEGELNDVAREIELVRDTCGEGVLALCGPAHGPEATRSRVRAALPGTTLAHFACHADALLSDPSGSHLRLSDGILPVREIARLRLDGAHLAYLSACSTARGGSDLADEAIHICSAFQLAGFRHVIGTLWPILDEAGYLAATSVYRDLRQDPDRVAHAVHAAALAARDAHPDQPLRWAAFVHTGP